MAVVLCLPALARAELVVLTTGRVLSVKAHRVESNGVIRLELREGGEATCDAKLVARIEPDEVPYPTQVESEAAVSPAASPAAIETAATPYDVLVAEAAAAHGLDTRLMHAVIRAESAYEPRARSARGAMGLMQLMPATARQYAVRDPYDPRANIEAGARHLAGLLERFDLPRALAAYNAGVAAVERFGGIPPYPETRAYVERVLRFAGLREAQAAAP